MRERRFGVILAVALAAALAACSGDAGGGGVDPGPGMGSVTARVSASGSGVEGAQVAVSGGETRSTGSNGQVRFDNLQPRDHTLTLQQLPTGFVMGSETPARTVTVRSGETASVSWSVASDGATVIQIVGTSFSPNSVTIPVGRKVRWVNDSGMFHTITSETDAWNEGQVSRQGDTFEHTFTTAGTFRYRCRPHSGSFTSGMVGTITVQ